MDYKEYLEEIKKKLDRLNVANGFNPQANNIKNIDNYDSTNDIIGGIGAAGKRWMDSHNQKIQDPQQIPYPNNPLIYK